MEFLAHYVSLVAVCSMFIIHGFYYTSQLLKVGFTSIETSEHMQALMSGIVYTCIVFASLNDLNS